MSNTNGDASGLAKASITLVIPAYNRADLLVATIDSALAQREPFAEIIVIDDGSTDHTPIVLQRYQGRIRTIRTPNAGVQSARNTGVAAAKTEYVCLCDSDDLLQRDYVAVMEFWLGKHPDVDIAYVNFRTFDERETGPEKFSQAPAGWFAGALSDGAFFWDIPDLYVRTVSFQPLFPTGSIYRKAFFEGIGGYDVRFNRVAGEDWEFALRAIAGGRVALCGETLTRIRKHPGNDSGDLAKLLLGEAQILEYVLAHHPAAKAFTAEIRASIQARRLDAFNTAFARGEFDNVAKALAVLGPQRQGARFQLKKIIASLPPRLRERAWRVTQG